MLGKEAISEVPPPFSPGFYGRIFVVPKTSGGWRPVLDLSALNKYVRQIKFRMETPLSVRDSIRQGDWATSLDLKDAYFHVLVHPRFRKWLRFTWAGKVFQFRVLPFGLSLSPWVFTRITRELACLLRAQGIRLRMYLDDWLILAQSSTACRTHLQAVLSQARLLGFHPNFQKSELNPSQRFEFLGMDFDSMAMLVRPSLRRIERLHETLANLRSRRSASARLLMGLLGTMESLAPLIPLGRLHKRPLQRALSQRWSPAALSWDHVIQLGPWFLEVTEQWLNLVWLRTGVPIVFPAHQLELYTDASNHGWGAHVLEHSAAGVWPPAQRGAHINQLEMEAVHMALLSFLEVLSGQSVLLCTDNTTVACYLNKQGGARSTPLSTGAEAILLLCQERGITLRARHVPGKLNILADALSRPHMTLNTEWTLSRDVLLSVWEHWFRPQVDLFATAFSHRLPLYVSPVPDPRALAVDALSIDWSGMIGYAFPPFPIIAKVLRKARIENATLILVAPRWPAQPWFPDLLSLSHTQPLRLRVRSCDLRQPRSGVQHANPDVLHLHAWLLCGSRCLH